MASSVPVAARADGHRRFPPGWRIVTVFAITQTIGYACRYYAFAVLLHPTATDLHTTTAAVTKAILRGHSHRFVMTIEQLAL